LQSGGATVQQVSAELGYESGVAFITMFKKARRESHRPGILSA
jgi:AraC-like DNA-binding protein